MNNFFFLAAGYGKRMETWTKSVPKPLLKIDGISFLDYALFLASNWGVNKSWINTHYLGDSIKKHLKNFDHFPITISHEANEILGTAGGIRSALNVNDFEAPLMLYNPDTLLFPNQQFSLRTNLPSDSKIHLYLSKLSTEDEYTKISIGKDSRLEFGKGDFFYIGLALIDPKCLLSLEPNQYADLSPIFKSLANTGQITGEVFQGHTLDLGEKLKYESYLNQNVFGETKPLILDFVSRYNP